MKIVLVDTTMATSQTGGAQTFLADLAAGLVQRSSKVHVVSEGQPNSVMGDMLAGTGAVVETDLWRRPRLVEGAAAQLARWVNGMAPDVYVVSTSPDVGWASIPYLAPGIATVAVAHSDSSSYYDAFSHYGPVLTAAVGVSEEICAKLIQACQLPCRLVDWIPYGVRSGPCPTQSESTSEGDPLQIIYAGRLTDELKRASDVISIIQRLRSMNLDYKLTIAGDGPLTSKFRCRLSPDIASGRVNLPGWLGRSDLLRILRSADVFLLTSEVEGFCISLAEAMANGLAPIVTDIPSGNRQLVRHMHNGLLAPVGDIETFVSHIQLLSANRHLLSTLRTLAWRTGQAFSMERMIDAYLDCFTTAVAAERSAPRKPNPGFPVMRSCRSRYPLPLRRLKLLGKRALARAGGCSAV